MGLDFSESYHLITALSLLVSSLLFYSIGVWLEHVRGKVRFWDIFFMLIGLVCNAIAIGFLRGVDYSMRIIDEVQLLLGVFTVLIILFHALWALWALSTIRKPDARAKFNRISIFIWCIWLVPYFATIYFTVSSHFS